MKPVRIVVAVVAVALASACALIRGPCTAELRPAEGLLACERGGFLFILRPPPTIKAATELVKEASEPKEQPDD